MGSVPRNAHWAPGATVAIAAVAAVLVVGFIAVVFTTVVAVVVIVAAIFFLFFFLVVTHIRRRGPAALGRGRLPRPLGACANGRKRQAYGRRLEGGAQAFELARQDGGDGLEGPATPTKGAAGAAIRAG